MFAFNPFDELDWQSYAGATPGPNGEQPVLGYKMGEGWEHVCIADETGIEVIITTEWRKAYTVKTYRRNREGIVGNIAIASTLPSDTRLTSTLLVDVLDYVLVNEEEMPLEF